MSIRVTEQAPEPAAALALEREAPSWQVVLGAYFRLTKPRIMVLLLLTTMAALLVADREHPLDAAALARVLLATLAGGALASGGAAALNCYIDRDIDAVMTRTRRRAIPAGVVAPARVLAFGLALSALSLLVLALFTNVVAALLALAGNFFYVVIYTLWLKRRTTQNIVLGGVAGAIPPLVGWAAVTGGVALPAVLMLVIVTYWTPAHFWSLALMVRRDYSRARVPMLPSVTDEWHSAWQILLYALLVVIATLLLYVAGAMGLIYLAAALGCGAILIARALHLLREPSSAARARRMFMYSNYYLAAIFAAMVLDRLVLVHL